MSEKWTDGLESGWDVNMSERGSPACPSANIRFWMPCGSDRTVVFLDNEPPFGFWEHGMKIGGDFRNFATCLQHMTDSDGNKMECILCALADDPKAAVSKYKAVPFTVIDRTEFVMKRGKDAGKRVKDSKRLLLAKNKIWEKLARRAASLKAEGKSLRGAEFKVFRGKDPQSPSVGDDFEYVRHVNLSEFADSNVFDYRELLKPDPELVKKYLLRLKASGIDSAPAERGSDDETHAETLPF